MTKAEELDAVEKEIFAKISNNEVIGLKALLSQIKRSINFTDENGMTPLQHACYKGNKDAVQMLIDQGADVDFCQTGAEYTPLHFAALSGNIDTILLLLEAGANRNTLNSVSRTPSQMAAFVGNHHCVATINSYISKSDVAYYTVLQGQQKEPYLPLFLLDSFHKLIIQTSLHPVRIALNIQKFGSLVENLKKIKKVLEVMTRREMQKAHDMNEVMAFKFHYIGYIVSRLIECQENHSADFITFFMKRIIKPSKTGEKDYLEYLIVEAARSFPFRECTIFRQIISQLSCKESPPALHILNGAINGQRGFVDDIKECGACGNEKPKKSCSRCRQVQYCDEECQKLHWFVHKKYCSEHHSAESSSSKVADSSEDVSEKTQNLTII